MKRCAGALLLILLLIQTIIKANTGLLPEMLWICYPAALLLAIGLLFDIALLQASGFLFHFCIGFPAYLLILITNTPTNSASFLLHFFTPAIGLWACYGKYLPIASSFIAAYLAIVFAIASYFFTAPELNINLVFKPWEPVTFLGLGGNRILNAALLFFYLFISRMGINRCLATR